MIYLNMNLDWLTCIQILEAPLQVVNGLGLNNIQKNWTLRDIVPTLTNTPLYQTGQGVFQTEL
jgi:hypothetical protein